MSENKTWKYLVRKPKSCYQQLFIKDRWVAARTLFGQSMGEDSRTPEQLAVDYQVPLEAVQEALAYCNATPPEIIADWEREESLIQANGMAESASRINGKPRHLTAQDRARIIRS